MDERRGVVEYWEREENVNGVGTLIMAYDKDILGFDGGVLISRRQAHGFRSDTAAMIVSP